MLMQAEPVYLAYEAVEEKIAGEGNLSRLPGNINEPGADAQTAGAEKKNAGSVSLSPGRGFLTRRWQKSWHRRKT